MDTNETRLSLGFIPQTSLSVLEHPMKQLQVLLSLGFIPQTSLSGEPGAQDFGPVRLSLGFIPQTSLSDLRSDQGCSPPAAVSGVHTPDFVE